MMTHPDLQDPDSGRQNPANDRRRLLPLINVGTTFAVAVALFAGGGYWLDQRRGGGILWTLVGAGLGLAYGAYEIWMMIRKIENTPPPPRPPTTPG
jgi:hypothetical protein